MLKKVFILLAAFGILASPASALSRRSPEGTKAEQSPNNSSIVVLVTDQSGLVVKDAKISVTNTQTGATRESMSGGDGRASFPTLPLTGTYSVTVSKPGFCDESRSGITLRSSETATLKVKLLVGTEKTEVTVIGTDQGVRADSQ